MVGGKFKVKKKARERSIKDIKKCIKEPSGDMEDELVFSVCGTDCVGGPLVSRD